VLPFHSQSKGHAKRIASCTRPAHIFTRNR
jgi:hypothetical protein